ncbi:hypothetical protein IT415_03895 [bacterium]|nr:hypothetical protein [bacterium]
MKTQFINDLKASGAAGVSDSVELFGWVANKRVHRDVVFIDIADSTGFMQIVVLAGDADRNLYNIASKLSVESCVKAVGTLTINQRTQDIELKVEDLELINEAASLPTPAPRADFDIFDPQFTHLLMSKRHIYMRNPKVMALMRFRSLVMDVARRWFAQNGFLEFDAPILVPAPLYDDRTAIDLEVHGEPAFLSQCAGFYLEAASQAFERVFNMAPSFRGEESRSKRHLSEYWHIKAELAWGNREDIMALVEDFIAFMNRHLNEEGAEFMTTLGVTPREDGMNIPFARISYEDAINYLADNGFDIEFGQGLGTNEEEALARLFDGPFWIVGIPRVVEPFPYVIDPDDNRLTMVADLIASDGYGELLGIAEKIFDPAMLHERMTEKNKHDDPRYEFVREVHDAGCSPHIAFGMGLERSIRWFLSIPHVRDTIPFPRVAGRRFYP